MQSGNIVETHVCVYCKAAWSYESKTCPICFRPQPATMQASIDELEERVERIEKRIGVKVLGKCVTSHTPVYWRGSVNDLVTDLRAIMKREELEKLSESIKDWLFLGE